MELLVVIAIIGLLSSIVLVSLGPVRERARDAQRQSDIRQISTAMELCYDDTSCGVVGETNQYPTFDSKPEAIGGGMDRPYMEQVPDDPLGDRDYGWINNTSDSQRYCVFAELEGEEDTWVAASHKGVRSDLSSEPTDLSCW